MNKTEAVVRYLPGSACKDWIEPQNPAFHISMLAFAAAFLAPYTFKYYVVALRGLLVAGFALLIFWGSMFWCTFDVVIWGLVFLIQNLAQLIYALYNMRRVQFPAELEDLYISLFEPFDVSCRQFKALINHNCKWVNIFPGDRYAVEDHTDVEARVSLLVSGCLRVTYKGIYLHDIKEKQLIDSVEWESTKMRRGELFQAIGFVKLITPEIAAKSPAPEAVTITDIAATVTAEAIDRCFYLCWNREKLQYYLEANPDLKVAFEYIRGHDIMEKVHQTALNAYRRSYADAGKEKVVDVISIRRGMTEESPDLIYH